MTTPPTRKTLRVPIVKVEHTEVPKPRLRHHDPVFLHLLGDASAIVAIAVIISPVVLVALVAIVAVGVLVFT